ncbi:hypothetical protein H6G89_27765 [Oscillatoria sp. FACHB-1407]|uniref:hypothetical protein n=1 Tax=Oscillatoria sp. FACHB-1407 TaxID=2692847 RepID=UPI001684E719|nr:hypothetical protein [Oscillatoria sp. FACHB-1407]MBD2464804.1 hypothetical protein [Oscillatoria sp. FACHB-1407]
MSNQISSQASKVWNIVSDPATADVYKRTGSVTWTILRETGILLWLIICLVLVAFDWFWTNSIWAGQRTRAWVNDLTSTGSDRLPSEAGKAILTVSKTGFASAIAQAREQLGLPEKKTPVLDEPVVTSPKPQLSATPTASGPAAPTTPVEPVKPSIPTDVEQLTPSVRAEVTPATTPEETQDDLL